MTQTLTVLWEKKWWQPNNAGGGKQAIKIAEGGAASHFSVQETLDENLGNAYTLLQWVHQNLCRLDFHSIFSTARGSRSSFVTKCKAEGK